MAKAIQKTQPKKPSNKKKQPPKKNSLTNDERYERNKKIYNAFVELRSTGDKKSQDLIMDVAKDFNLSWHFVRSVIYFRSKWMTEKDYKGTLKSRGD